jgi:hypothetical protein
MGNTGAIISSILLAVIGLAIISVLVSKNAQTGSVLKSAGSAFGSIITAAVSPVSGGIGTGLGTGLPSLS